MAIIHPIFLDYVVATLCMVKTSEELPFYFDCLLQLAENCLFMSDGDIDKHSQDDFSESIIASAKSNIARIGVLGVVPAYFKNPILIEEIVAEVERKVVTLKRGYPNLPSTKMSTIIRGFGHEIGSSEVLSIYASYGLVRTMKDLADYDFVEINRRISRLSVLLSDSFQEEALKVHRRYLAIRSYVKSAQRKKEKAIEESGLGRSLFFYYWKSFKDYGLLGLVDRGQEVFRESKVGLANEAKMIVDKLQHPEREESFYIQRLKYKGIGIDRSTISRIFTRWGVSHYQSAFVSDLERLSGEAESEETLPAPAKAPVKATRLMDANMLKILAGMEKDGMYVSAPGIFVLWAYLEELGIFPILESMELTGGERVYGWLDHLLLNVGRIFYGISSYSRACDQEETTLALFCHLVTLPCNDTLLKWMGNITQKQVFELQKWLVIRTKELGLISGKRLAFDFHHIDLDVEMDRLRLFGRGPSPHKKICCNGFRPHIAWDIDTGEIVVMEFRKASARGTTTVNRFIKDFLLTSFEGLFQEIYLDSEYTGKAVWNYILDKDSGIGANIIACIKQNAMVRKKRNTFLLNSENKENFWSYYDEDHVYSTETFVLQWEYLCPATSEKKTLALECVVKKNVRNGKLRCFGTSKKGMSSKEILSEYSHRWTIENGIKDLIQSYFMDNAPGTTPHLVNVHFLVVTICRQLYHMIYRDLGDYARNADNTVKSLATIRESLFHQGCARVTFSNGVYQINFLNSYSPKLTRQLSQWFETLEKRWSGGIDIIGGSKLKFILQPPYGEDHRNARRKLPLDNIEKFSEDDKIL